MLNLQIKNMNIQFRDLKKKYFWT